MTFDHVLEIQPFDPGEPTVVLILINTPPPRFGEGGPPCSTLAMVPESPMPILSCLIMRPATWDPEEERWLAHDS
jgi:hypothetical protein